MIFLIIAGFLQNPSCAYTESQEENQIGIDERLGGYIPHDLSFYDEFGKPIVLSTLINKPTIISFAYYRCSNLCSTVFENLAELLGRLQAEPGIDYSVITISFDKRDTPADALQKKRDYMKSIGRPFPEDSWKFLTGNKENIAQLTDAVGFRFKEQGQGFEHPAMLTVVSPQGKIIRYFYGTTYLPADVKMALNEALEERTGPTIPRALLLCYTYDPKSRTYALNILPVAGVGIILFAAGFFIYLTKTNRKNQ